MGVDTATGCPVGGSYVAVLVATLKAYGTEGKRTSSLLAGIPEDATEAANAIRGGCEVESLPVR